MSRPQSSVVQWLQRRFSWLVPADSGHAVVECLAGLLLLIEAAALLWYWRSIPAAVQVILWLQWLAVLAGLRVRGYFLLFGPVLNLSAFAQRRPQRSNVQTLTNEQRVMHVLQSVGSRG